MNDLSAEPAATAAPPGTDDSSSARKPERLLRLREVEERLGLRKTTIYKLVSLRQMPPPVTLAARTVAWRESQIDEFIATRPVQRSLLAEPGIAGAR